MKGKKAGAKLLDETGEKPDEKKDKPAGQTPPKSTEPSAPNAERSADLAVELMKQVLSKISLSENWIYYDALAAGQAECGDFEGAIRSQMTAIAMYKYSMESNSKWRSMYYRRLVQYLCYEPHRAKRDDDAYP